MDASIASDGNSVSLRNLEKRVHLTPTGHLRGHLRTDNSQKNANVPIENEELLAIVAVLFDLKSN